MLAGHGLCQMPCAIPSARTAVAVNESAAMALLEPFAPRSVDFARSASQRMMACTGAFKPLAHARTYGWRRLSGCFGYVPT